MKSNHLLIRRHKRRDDGIVVRELTSHQCGPSLILAQCHMWVEIVVTLLQGFFSGFSGFPPSTKINTLNSNLTRIEDLHENKYG